MKASISFSSSWLRHQRQRSKRDQGFQRQQESLARLPSGGASSIQAYAKLILTLLKPAEKCRRNPGGAEARDPWARKTWSEPVKTGGSTQGVARDRSEHGNIRGGLR